ncbi:hypothetical protein SAMN04487969_1064 [Paenibacillus algorifonticola]|uniref:Uncharacterized protein n=1 Tax=Paenibacillus algorifonticola TaxID=684063 RepID=A0A1I2CZA7_9BACL|nr:hypothetical protein SAMN04487969_1064 [Paenibacillus algorifonticola]
MVLAFFISFNCNRFNKVMVLKDGAMVAFDILENLRNRNETYDLFFKNQYIAG